MTKWQRKYERMKADPALYQAYLEHRRELYWRSKGQDPEQKKREREERMEAVKENVVKTMRGESTEQTRAKYNRITAKAIETAEWYRKNKWRGLHRYDAAMQFIREGMPDEEIIERVGMYKDYEDGTKHPDYHTLEVYKKVYAGKISKGHVGMTIEEVFDIGEDNGDLELLGGQRPTDQPDDY